MTSEQARILAAALKTQEVARVGILNLVRNESVHDDLPAPIADSVWMLAETYVHETRVINRIISDARDEADSKTNAQLLYHFGRGEHSGQG